MSAWRSAGRRVPSAACSASQAGSDSGVATNCSAPVAGRTRPSVTTTSPSTVTCAPTGITYSSCRRPGPLSNAVPARAGNPPAVGRRGALVERTNQPPTCSTSVVGSQTEPVPSLITTSASLASSLTFSHWTVFEDRSVRPCFRRNDCSRYQAQVSRLSGAVYGPPGPAVTTPEMASPVPPAGPTVEGDAAGSRLMVVSEAVRTFGRTRCRIHRNSRYRPMKVASRMAREASSTVGVAPAGVAGVARKVTGTRGRRPRVRYLSGSVSRSVRAVPSRKHGLHRVCDQRRRPPHGA